METTIEPAARLNLRLNSDQKRMVEQAAAALGKNITDYVVETLGERSARVLEEHRSLVLSNEAFDAFIRALENPSPPTESLRRAMERYRENPI